MVLKAYCLACRKHTNNIASRKVTMTNQETNQDVVSVYLINQSS